MPPKRLTENQLRLLLSYTQSFWNKVKIGTPDECWNWVAKKRSGLYGHFSFGPKKSRLFIVSNRAAWILFNRRNVPGDLRVLHTCIGNGLCCNPRHLKLGTMLDNMRDKVAQGRQYRASGELQWEHKLTDSKVIEIRKLWSARTYSQSKLAKMFGVCQASISHVVLRKTWMHI